MKLKSFFAMSVAFFCLTACSEDEKQPDIADIAGNYEGYTLANCAYFQNNCTANESVRITKNADGSAHVTFTSDAWGILTIPHAQMSENRGIYTLTGNGQTQMGMGENIASYDCTYTATVTPRAKAQMQFNVAGVMGGLTIDFVTGEAPADFLLAGTYNGYTDADCAYFQDRYTNNESLKMTANGDGTLAVAFESATWGTFNVAKATVTKAGDEYTFTGEGTVSMGMGNNTNDYPFTMTGTCNATKDAYSVAFNTPAVMGGLTVTLLPGSISETAEQ